MLHFSLAKKEMSESETALHFLDMYFRLIKNMKSYHCIALVFRHLFCPYKKKNLNAFMYELLLPKYFQNEN